MQKPLIAALLALAVPLDLFWVVRLVQQGAGHVVSWVELVATTLLALSAWLNLRDTRRREQAQKERAGRLRRPPSP